MTTFKSQVEDCWCEEQHTDPFTELGHLILAEFRPLAEWLEKGLRRWNER